MELQGKLIEILKTKSGTSKSGKDWKVVEFLIEVDGDYPKKVALKTFQANEIENQEAGSILKCSIDIESREYKGNYYTDVKAWKIEPVDGERYVPFSDNNDTLGFGEGNPIPDEVKKGAKKLTKSSTKAEETGDDDMGLPF